MAPQDPKAYIFKKSIHSKKRLQNGFNQRQFGKSSQFFWDPSLIQQQNHQLLRPSTSFSYLLDFFCHAGLASGFLISLNQTII